jgi:peptide-methionine (S)-S-oxide reductase
MIEKAAFGAGCFWHVEEEFRNLKGVVKTTVGYMGGKLNNPTYEDVCTDKTGHVEVCEVKFDPNKIKYEELLEKFWEIHDPTQIDKQGPDVGTQYKSVIFYYNDDQKNLALASKEKEQRNHKQKIATKIIPAEIFYEAEDYHQKYLMKRSKNTCY